MAMPISLIKDLSIILAGTLALVTFFTGFYEYQKRSRQDRAQHFIQMRRRFLETPQHREILHMMATCDGSLAAYPVQDKRNFVGFLEEVALMVNSELIRRDVAHYMFGYYVIMTDECLPFWEGMDRESMYWTLFRGFAVKMREEREAKHLRELAI